MRKFLGWLAFLLLTGGALPARGADAPMAEIVVAMRYFQQTGASHSHLYLYREDGKLLRQLTNDNTGQDREPMFSPDGEVIVFARRNDKGGTDYYSIEPRGGNLRMIRETPQWYVDTKDAPGMGHVQTGPPIVRESGGAPARVCTITLPEGKAEVVITPAADAEDHEAPEKWKVRLQPTDGKAIQMGELSGYSAGFLSDGGGEAAQYLLHDGALSVVFCFLHLGSTDGDTVVALDLNAKRPVPLSPNWAEPIPLPGQPAFLTFTENRYIPFGDGKRTVNCSYIEHWDAKLQKIRYAKEKAAGDCYGASMYRPGKTPAMLVIRPAKE